MRRPLAVFYDGGSEERMWVAENAPPGWYQAETDTPGLERYWDGSQWTAETRSAMAPPPPTGAASAVGDRITPHGREIASAGSRIGARFIDFVLVAIVAVPIVISGVDFDNLDAESFQSIDSGRAWLVTVVGAAYEILFTALKGATPGKMALGIEIVRKNDGVTPLGFGTATLRWVPNAASWILPNLGTLVFLASLVLLFADRMRRTVFDFVGQTYVVRKLR